MDKNKLKMVDTDLSVDKVNWEGAEVIEIEQKHSALNLYFKYEGGAYILEVIGDNVYKGQLASWIGKIEVEK